ncbi:MAG: molybdate ABC transporter permease subunit [Gammaproteobacteria bacterium]|nr:molybdate ABC transporter permease subunit [Gammaproteobacteria bacterium]
MMLTADDITTLWLSIKIAGITTFILLLIGTPLAWWLARTQSRWRGFFQALIALPLVLPPTVLGFYLLLLMGPKGLVGQFTEALGLGTLPFTFWGLVIASVIYSLPFVVQPLQAAFAMIGRQLLEAAATLKAGSTDIFINIVLPMAKPGFLTAAILGFAHTIGEFGVVLMIGGNIPDKTRVVSVQLYNHVEALEYGRAHWLAGCLLLFSFIVLFILYSALKIQTNSQSGK